MAKSEFRTLLFREYKKEGFNNVLTELSIIIDDAANEVARDAVDNERMEMDEAVEIQEYKNLKLQASIVDALSETLDINLDGNYDVRIQAINNMGDALTNMEVLK